jgi:hypothetical protein
MTGRSRSRSRHNRQEQTQQAGAGEDKKILEDRGVILRITGIRSSKITRG